MTSAELIFKAWDFMAFTPHAQQERMRETVKRADAGSWPLADMPLAFVLLATEDKNLVWTTRRIVGEWPELTEETIH
jgi:hypothetical protein